MANIWDGVSQRTVHCAGATPEAITASLTLDWSTVNLGTDSLSRYFELDARTASVSIKVPAAPGVAHNGRKLKIAVNRDDSSTANFRGVVFTGGSPVERGTLPIQSTYAMDRRSGHIVIEVINGIARINSGASFNQDPALPSNAALLAILQGWTTGATWTDIGGGEARVQFTANGSFAPTRALSAWVLGVAGGGGGGKDHAGGGGGGFASDVPAFAISAGSHAITIGAGGTAPAANDVNPVGANGGNTSFGSLFTWLGGGRGGGRIQAISGDGSAPTSGGPGGGGGGTGTGTTAGINPRGAAANSQGFAGGNGNNISSNAGQGGGGGGAGGVGGNASGTGAGTGDGSSGDGGLGISSSITGSTVGYGGGGAGGRWANGALGTIAPGGVNYGGGPGEGASDAGNQNGLTNRGGGGGGGGDGGKVGGNGGSGTIIIRVPLVAAIGL